MSDSQNSFTALQTSLQIQLVSHYILCTFWASWYDIWYIY